MAAERHVFKQRTFVCPACGDKVTKLLWSYDPVPTCAAHGAMVEGYGQARRAAAVIGDDIPGGLMIEHGICNPDGTPKRYDTKSSIRDAAKAAGFFQWVEHIPERGSDKSPHTTRWI